MVPKCSLCAFSTESAAVIGHRVNSNTFRTKIQRLELLGFSFEHIHVNVSIQRWQTSRRILTLQRK